MRRTGNDSQAKQLKWLARVTQDRCAQPDISCRHVYSMGVRQAVWRQRLWAEPDMRLVSAGVPDYLDAVQRARFCLHTEGNGWGARVVDYAAMECIPLVVNDRMILPYANILHWPDFSIHMRKRDVPQATDLPRPTPLSPSCQPPPRMPSADRTHAAERVRGRAEAQARAPPRSQARLRLVAPGRCARPPHPLTAQQLSRVRRAQASRTSTRSPRSASARPRSGDTRPNSLRCIVSQAVLPMVVLLP